MFFFDISTRMGLLKNTQKIDVSLRKTIAFTLVAFLAIPLGFLVILRLKGRVQQNESLSRLGVPALQEKGEELGEGMFSELQQLNKAYEEELEKMEAAEGFATTTTTTTTATTTTTIVPTSTTTTTTVITNSK